MTLTAPRVGRSAPLSKANVPSAGKYIVGAKRFTLASSEFLPSVYAFTRA
jgi:hypothetical protein